MSEDDESSDGEEDSDGINFRDMRAQLRQQQKTLQELQAKKKAKAVSPKRKTAKKTVDKPPQGRSGKKKAE